MASPLITILTAASTALASTAHPAIHNPGFQSSEFDIRIESSSESGFVMVVELGLAPDAYVHSPQTKSEIYLPFSFAFHENAFVAPDGAIAASPESRGERDPHTDEWVLVNRGPTEFRQAFDFLQPGRDFSIFGSSFFVVEPACTPHEVVFHLKRENGQLTLQQLFDRPAAPPRQ